MELSNQQLKYVTAVVEHAPDLGIDTTKTDYSRAELRQVSMRMKGKVWIPNWITHDQSRRVSRGVFSIPEIMEHTITGVNDIATATVTSNVPDSVEPLDDIVVDTTDDNDSLDDVVGDDTPMEDSEVMTITDDVDETIIVEDDMVATTERF